MKIYIPSLGRAGRVKTLWSLSVLDRAKDIILVVQPQELDQYREAHRGIEVLPLPHPMHIGQTRKFIIGYAGDNHWQMDDDVTVRELDGHKFAAAFIEQELLIRRYGLVGFGRQFMGNQNYEKGRFQRDHCVWHMLGVNYRNMNNVPVEHFSLYEDTVMNIHAREYGGTIVDYAMLLANGSYTKKDGSGCSSYRTVEEISRNMHELAVLYPKYCEIVPSTNLTQGLPVGKTVRTAWSKIRRLQS